MSSMLRLTQRSLVGRADAHQRSGVIIHPTQDLVVLYAISSPTAGEAFLSYCQEQLTHEQPTNTLEFHQLLDRCVSTAGRMEVELSLVGVCTFDEHVVLAAYQGSVWLKRGDKLGQILSAEGTLQLLEGKIQVDDIYVLFTRSAQGLQEVVQGELLKAQPETVLSVVDAAELRTALDGAPDEALTGVSLLSVVDSEKDHQALTADIHASAEPVVATPASESVVIQPSNSGSKVTALLKGIGGALLLIRNEVAQLFSKDVYVRQKQRRSLGKVLIVFFSVILLLLWALVFWRNRQQQQQQQIQATLQPFQIQFEEVRTLSLQNTVDARQRAEQLIASLEAESQKQNQPQYLQTAVLAELQEVRQFYQSISGQEELPNLPIFFDLRLVQSNFLASRIDATLDTLFFLDSGQKKILALNIERKQPTLLPIGEYPDIRALVADDQFLYFLGEGLFRFTLSGTDVASLVENPDDPIKTGQTLGLFDRYLYVLSKEQNNIFRYDTADNSLDGKPTAWIQAGQGIDLNQVQSFAIDGDVWLSMQTGEIKKLTSGREVAFTVSGMKEPFSSPITLFTKPEMLNLYVLEPQKSRVVVLNKEGQFIKEIKNENLAAATAVVASEPQHKAFALSGSLVYEIEL